MITRRGLILPAKLLPPLCPGTDQYGLYAGGSYMPGTRPYRRGNHVAFFNPQQGDAAPAGAGRGRRRRAWEAGARERGQSGTAPVAGETVAVAGAPAETN